MALTTSPIAATRNPTTTGTTLPDYMAGLSQYVVPKMDMDTTSATGLVGEATGATLANAPNLEKIGQLVSQINQQAYLSAPGRQQELGNIQRWQAGELDPSVYSDVASRAAQLYGGGGFGVDSPAWQAAVQRAIVTNRQALEEKGAGALENLYRGLPTTDVQKYTLTPAEVAAQEQAAKSQSLEYARMLQSGALQTAQLQQQRAIQEQEFALKEREYEDARRLANLKAGLSPGGGLPYGFDVTGRWVPGGRYSSGYTDVMGRFHPTA